MRFPKVHPVDVCVCVCKFSPVLPVTTTVGNLEARDRQHWEVFSTYLALFEVNDRIALDICWVSHKSLSEKETKREQINSSPPK